MKYLPIAALAMFGLSAPLQAECLDEIKAMMKAHLAAGPYHVDMDQTSDAGNHKVEADVILPSSFRFKSPPVEGVMLKEGTWMKINGNWMQLPAAASAQMTGTISNAIKSGMDGNLANLKNVQCLGPQSIEGKTLSAYSFDASGEAMGIKATSHITAYKDDQGRPAVMIVEGEAMGHKSKTVQHITYDPSITITPPK